MKPLSLPVAAMIGAGSRTATFSSPTGRRGTRSPGICHATRTTPSRPAISAGRGGTAARRARRGRTRPVHVQRAVEFHVTGPFEEAYHCHCGRCRRARAAAHASNGIIPTERVHYVRGEDLPEELSSSRRRAISPRSSATGADPICRTSIRTAGLPSSLSEFSRKTPGFDQAPTSTRHTRPNGTTSPMTCRSSPRAHPVNANSTMNSPA